MAKTFTKHEFQAKLDEKFSLKTYSLIGPYTGQRFSHTFRHKCGNKFECIAANLSKGVAKCSCEHQTTGPKISALKAQKRLDKKFGSKEYKLVGPYTGNLDVHTFKHKCGQTLEVGFISLMCEDSKCPCLHKHNWHRTKKSHTIEIQGWRNTDWECVKYNGVHVDNVYRHKICGKTFKAKLTSFKMSKGCPHCDGLFGTKKNILTKKAIVTRLTELHGKNVYKLLDEHKNVKDFVDFKHVECGHVFQSQMEVMLRNKYRCPKCYSHGFKTIAIDGLKFRCQGFEPTTLKWLTKKYNPNYIITGCSKKRKQIRYKFRGKKHVYYPDFYIKKANLIVETKCVTTFINPKEYYFFGENTFERNKAKALACVNKGYNFKLDLYSDEGKKKLKLPKNWMLLSKKRVYKCLQNQLD